MADKHTPYFPQRRENDDADKHARRLSKHDAKIQAASQRPDLTFHGSTEMDQRLSIHNSFDYHSTKPTSQDKYVHSKTEKNVKTYRNSINSDKHQKVFPNQDEVLDMYDFEEAEARLKNNDFEAGPVDDMTSQGKSHHHGSHRPTKRDHYAVVHADDPHTQSQLAHNPALDVHAPTMAHAAEGDWCSSRCLVSSIFIIVSLGLIVT